MRFIPPSIQNENSPGADAEKEVFDRLKAAFRGDTDGLGLYRPPFKDRAGHQFDREPDFVIVHKDFGLVVIEVKGYEIQHINDITGQSWNLTGIGQDVSFPYSQARDQAFFIQSKYFQRETELRDERGNCIVPANAIVALPNISRKEWEENGFEATPSARVLHGDDLTPQNLRERLDDLPHTDTLSELTIDTALAALTGGKVIRESPETPEIEPEIKNEYYRLVRGGLKKLDQEQQEIGIATPDGPQQIRGIAGSGKTVLLAMKAAGLHVKNPDWRIAFTFNTKSLYESIESLLDRFVAHYSDGERKETLEVLHGWGGKSDHGLYYKIAQEAGYTSRDVASARRMFGNDLNPAELLDENCKELIREADIQQRYDAIFIDEGQDFEPGFYKMCYRALTDEKRLIWAYDEAQNLSSLTAPTPPKIFGQDRELLPEKLDLQGAYKGGIQKSLIMRRSYRAPRQALMAAHSMGMALKRPDLAVPRIKTKPGWEDIGYEVEGDFREIGETIRIKRPEKFSQHPLQEWPEAGPFVSFDRFDSRDAEVNYVARSVHNDIENEGLRPEDILIIPLGASENSKPIGENVADQLETFDVDSNIVWEGNVNFFTSENNVTISRVNRAKGNEAAQVYVMNVEATEQERWDSNLINNRNELFVAMTRTRGWCNCTGVEDTESIYDELEETIEETAEPSSEITFPAPPHREIDIDEQAGLPSFSQADIDDFD